MIRKLIAAFVLICMLFCSFAMGAFAMDALSGNSEETNAEEDRGVAISCVLYFGFEYLYNNSHGTVYEVRLFYSSNVTLYRMYISHVYMKPTSALDPTIYYNETINKTGLNSYSGNFNCPNLTLPYGINTFRLTVVGGSVEDYSSNVGGLDFTHVYTLQ